MEQQRVKRKRSIKYQDSLSTKKYNHINFFMNYSKIKQEKGSTKYPNKSSLMIDYEN